ncbi:hypothetical protein GCM10010106_45870 [Thermopolyspora flexuosa]|nr:hypothetical protein GCM10010106_45870 [Thermopolyspora flexuosa]
MALLRHAGLCSPEVDDRAVIGLKFSVVLSRHLASVALDVSFADFDHAAAVLDEPIEWLVL